MDNMLCPQILGFDGPKKKYRPDLQTFNQMDNYRNVIGQELQAQLVTAPPCFDWCFCTSTPQLFRHYPRLFGTWALVLGCARFQRCDGPNTRGSNMISFRVVSTCAVVVF